MQNIECRMRKGDRSDPLPSILHSIFCILHFPFASLPAELYISGVRHSLPDDAAETRVGGRLTNPSGALIDQRGLARLSEENHCPSHCLAMPAALHTAAGVIFARSTAALLAGPSLRRCTTRERQVSVEWASRKNPPSQNPFFYCIYKS